MSEVIVGHYYKSKLTGILYLVRRIHDNSMKHFICFVKVGHEPFLQWSSKEEFMENFTYYNP